MTAIFVIRSSVVWTASCACCAVNVGSGVGFTVVGNAVTTVVGNAVTTVVVRTDVTVVGTVVHTADGCTFPSEVSLCRGSEQPARNVRQTIRTMIIPGYTGFAIWDASFHRW